MRPAEPVDFLDLEQPLIARIRAAVPANVYVLGAADLARVAEPDQPTPAVQVVYLGYRPGKADNTIDQEVDLFWLTVVAINAASTPISGDAARAAAGPLLGMVIGALGPWVPEGYKAMHLDHAPAAHYRAGFGYFPIGWRVSRRIRVGRAKP